MVTIKVRNKNCTPGLPATCFRSSVGMQKNCNTSFKSPMQLPSSSLMAGTKEALRKDIEDLRQRNSALDKETQQLMAEGYSIHELDEHISLLHEYNDLKDAGQLLMGRLDTLQPACARHCRREEGFPVEKQALNLELCGSRFIMRILGTRNYPPEPKLPEAVLRGVTTKDLYTEFDLDLED